MGTYCSTQSKHKDDLQVLRQYDDRAFGFIKVIRSDKLCKDIAVKQIIFKSRQQLQKYSHTADIAKEYDNIPTLVKLNGFTIDPLQDSYVVTVNFDYVPTNFGQVLFQKKVQLGDFVNKNKRSLDMAKLNKIKLYDYETINQLASQEKKYVESFYLEAEILRMMDHIIGAVYFLNHFESDHMAVRPDNILIDSEGKYILIDRKVMLTKTNYEVALHQRPGTAACCYLSPQQFKSLKQKSPSPEHNPQLSDIFAVGLIALQMATMQSLASIYDYNSYLLNTTQLSRLFDKASSRYSSAFISMLRSTLSISEQQRINFSTLIDMLSPILTNSLENLNRVYGPPSESTSSSIMQLHDRLVQMELNYQHIMMTRTGPPADLVDEEELIRYEEGILGKTSRSIRETEDKENQINGRGLYEMYLKEYESIKKSREKI